MVITVIIQNQAYSAWLIDTEHAFLQNRIVKFNPRTNEVVASVDLQDNIDAAKFEMSDK